MSENISIRVTWEEKQQIDSYAKLQGKSVSEMMKELFFEKLEDEFDLKLIQEYENEQDKETYSLAEAKKILGLWGF